MNIIDGIRGVAPRRNVAVAGAVAAMALMPMASARAGVEYATRVTDCTNHVAGPGNPLTVMAGSNMQFEVFGNSIDLISLPSGFRFSGPSGMTATVLQRRSGSHNSGRGCGFIGSAVISVSTPGTLSATSSGAVSFQMPLGDFSSLALSFVPFPALAQATWTSSGSLQPTSLPCIVKTGSISAINQDTKLVIQLPPGAPQDQSTCTSNQLSVRVAPTTIPSVDIAPSFIYTVTGLPSFLSVTQSPPAVTPMTFTFNVAAIRALTTTSNSTITISNPINTNRSTTLTLQVVPTAGQGFSQVATANPGSTTAGNPIDFTLHLSAPASNQVITWRMTQAACFRQAVPDAPYRATSPFQFYSVPDGVTSTIIRVLSANNNNCTNKLAPTVHIFEAWAGDSRVDPQVTAVTSGAKYTRTNISLLAP